MKIFPDGRTDRRTGGWTYARVIAISPEPFDRGMKNLIADEMFRTATEAKDDGSVPVKHVKAPSGILLTVSRRYFCRCSSMLHSLHVCGLRQYGQ